MNNENRFEQVAASTRHYHEPVEPHGSNTGSIAISVVFGIAFFALLIVGIVQARQQIADASVVVVYITLPVLFIIGLACLVYPLWHNYHMRKMKREHANLDIQAKQEQMEREQEEHRMRMYLAESRLYPDSTGNYPVVFDRQVWNTLQLPGGNFVQPVPSHVHFEYNNTANTTGVESQALLSPGSPNLALPKIEEFYEAIKFNSLQVGLGLDTATDRLVLASIEKSTHFKFIGGSGQGKSCVAASVLDIATTMNDPDHLRLGLLDLEHNTSRLFEQVPHIAEIGPKRQRLMGTNPDEVAHKLKLLQWELTRRSELGEEHCRQYEPLLLVYVEEMLALKYEVVDPKLNKEMLAAINILGVRGRKYLIFFLVCMQTDYSDTKTREAMAQYRTRGGFAIDPDTARASGFFDLDKIKTNFQVGEPGRYVLEKPGYSGIVLAPDYDVKSKLMALEGSPTRPPIGSPIGKAKSPYDIPVYPGANSQVIGVTEVPPTPTYQAVLQGLSEQQKRILKKYREGMSVNAIIQSEFTDNSGKPLTAGVHYTQRAKEIQALIARFLPE